MAGEAGADRSVVVSAFDPAGVIAPTELLRLPDPSRSAGRHVVALSGSGGAVVANSEHRWTQRGKGADEQTVASRLVVVDDGREVAACPRDEDEYVPSFEGVAGHDFVAHRVECPAPSRPAVLISGSQGERVVSAAPAIEYISRLRAAGSFVAWQESRFGTGKQAPEGIVIADGAGNVLARIASGFVADYVLAADGHVYFAGDSRRPDGACRLMTASVTDPAPRLAGTYECPWPGASAADPSGAAAVLWTWHAWLLVRGGVIERAIPSPPPPNPPYRSQNGVAFDGTTFSYVRVDCDADRLIRHPIDAPAPPASPRCKVRYTDRRHIRITDRNTVRFALTCPHGCRDQVDLMQWRERNGKSERRYVGTGRLASPPGDTTVQIKLLPGIRARAACPGGLRARASWRESDGRGAEIVLRANGRCRRHAGPAFAPTGKSLAPPSS